MISAEDLLARLLAIIDIVTDDKTVDPKHVESFRRLLSVGDLTEASVLWSEYKRSNELSDFDQTWSDVQRKLAGNANLLKPEVSSQDLDKACPWCVDSAEFPVASRARVFEVLGYV